MFISKNEKTRIVEDLARCEMRIDHVKFDMKCNGFADQKIDALAAALGFKFTLTPEVPSHLIAVKATKGSSKK